MALTRKGTVLATTFIDQQLDELVAGIGVLMHRGSATEADPAVISLPEPGHNAYPDFEIRLWVTERTNGAEILFVEMEIGRGGAPGLNLDELKEWTDAYNTRSLFGSIETLQSGSGREATYITTIHHALVLDGLTHKTLETVVTTMQVASRRCHRVIRMLVRDHSREILAAQLERARRTALTDLEALVGLQSVKEMVRGLTAQQRVEQERKKHGLRPALATPHLVFTGNPGTGKTTVARLVGKLFREIGLLPRGHVVEVDRSDLVAKYVGQTAIKTKEVCDRAVGGVLFIDEAYALTGTGVDFGHEAIEALLTTMESRRGEFVVIVAGYGAEMTKFIASNPGLESRFDRTIHFPDYSADELFKIFEGLVRDHDYVLDPAAAAAVRTCMRTLPRGQGFGNAREIRRIFNDVVCNHASLLMNVSNPTKQQLQSITAAAIPSSHVPTSVPASEGTASTPRWAGYL